MAMRNQELQYLKVLGYILSNILYLVYLDFIHIHTIKAIQTRTLKTHIELKSRKFITLIVLKIHRIYKCLLDKKDLHFFQTYVNVQAYKFGFVW